MARPNATDRLGRILSMVPWIASQPEGALIDETCERFGIQPKALLDDLNVVFLVGLYPYTPESLVDVDVDDDRVHIRYTNFFERPLRLSPDEGLALLAAGVASSGQPGHDADGPLARGVRKVAAVLDIDLDDDLAVVLADEGVEHHELIDQSIADGTVLHIDYFSHARNTATSRDIEPLRRFATDGIWYLDAHCRSSGDHRVFRIDRITSADRTDESFDPTRPVGHAVGPPSSFRPGDELTRVTIEMSASEGWVLEQYPYDDVVADGDRLRVTLAVTARPWLERLLLRLGADARVVAGDDLDGDDLADVGETAAARLLARYAE